MLASLPVGAAVAEGAPTTRLIAVALTAVAASIASNAIAGRTSAWWAPLAVVLPALVLISFLIGPAAASALLVSTAVASWSLLDRPPPSLGPLPEAAAPPLVGLTVAGAVLTARVGAGLSVAAAAVVAVAAVALSRRPAMAQRIATAVDRAAAAIARVVIAAVMAVVGLIVVVVPWAFQRLLRWDPTWVPHPEGSRFVPVRADGSASASTRLWQGDLRTVRSTPGRRVHRVAVFGAGAILVIALIGGTLGALQARKENERYSAAALADQPWWPAMSDAMDIAYGTSPISSYVGVMMRDAHFPGFNVTDHQRSTWQPQSTGCRPVRIWMFGGSTLFGLGQRDGHTIASELARRAWQDGIALEISNWGVPADTSWMATRRLELALAEGRPTPDLVLFYDGANDYRSQIMMNGTGRGGQRLFANDLDWAALPGIETRNERLAALMQIVREGPEMPQVDTVVQTPEEVGAFAVRGYNATDEMVRPLLESRGITGVRFYQPVRSTRSSPVPEEQPAGPEDNQARVERAFRAGLAPGIVDLSTAMDSTTRPVYYDEMHTNELGARLVADAMYEHLRVDLEQRTEGSPPCRS